MNNQHKIIISIHGVPLKKCFFFFQKALFLGDKLFREKNFMERLL